MSGPLPSSRITLTQLSAASTRSREPWRSLRSLSLAANPSPDPPTSLQLPRAASNTVLRTDGDQAAGHRPSQSDSNQETANALG
ncbi:hypothetical protein K438DRAFT_1809635, partial [Mycena galopus ATCC 62051]